MTGQTEFNVAIATDCGSTTTKAILIEKKNGEYRQTFRGEAPTTVEAPFEDVTRGVLNAFQEVEELSGRKILDGENLMMPARADVGVDLYISTSSAGGGLQMMVAGAVKTMTGESAERAALGAGAIVMDVLATNDGRKPFEKIERIRRLRPDIMLLSGGTDGGTISHVVELAEYIAASNPRPRLGATFKLPLIYAGNRDAREEVRETLGDKLELHLVENIRPTLETENLAPAREEIQNLFLEHVMAQAPGYKKLISWTSSPIMPTPAAVGEIIRTVASERNLNVIGVDIGGATTDVFSVFAQSFHRTVSANLGMSYSISNVVAESGLDSIMRWLPFHTEETRLKDDVKNKMVRPTTIPQTVNDLIIEQAIAREALRLAFAQHRLLAVGLKGVRQERGIADAFEQKESGETLIRMGGLNLLIGSGGVLSHAPRRAQAMLMLIDAFLPEGVTQLAVDSVFMMPHLGVLATHNLKAAFEVFEKDCLVPLGTCLAPLGGSKKEEKAVEIRLELPAGVVEEEVMFGELKRYALSPHEEARFVARPGRHFDMGHGKGRTVEGTCRGGTVGIVVDARGRPLKMPADKAERIKQVSSWYRAIDLYPAWS